MKIAFINHPICNFVPPPQEGSLEIWVHEVARRLARSCEVVVYSSRGSLPREEWCEGVQYRRISDPSRAERVIRSIQRLKGGWRATRGLRQGMYDYRSRLYYFGYSYGVAIDLLSQHCDVAHVMNLSQFVPILHALNPRLKIGLHMECEWLTRLDRSMIEKRLKNADRIIGCSDFVTNQIRDAFPRFGSRCLTVYNGVNEEDFVPNRSQRAGEDGVRRILFVGRVSPEKGLHVLLDAFAMVVKRYPQARLQIIGPPAQFPFDLLPTACSAAETSRLAPFYDGKGYVFHLKEQIASLKLAQAVTFVGRLSQRSLAPSYQQTDVFVFPSVWNETFGMPLTEAMSSGVPVVATRVGGIPEVVEDGKTGLLVEPNDPSALAEAILRLLDNEDLRLSMGEAARRRAIELFSWDKVAQDLLNVYNGLASGRDRVRDHASVAVSQKISVETRSGSSRANTQP
ncbi:MAG TPA: glycosyltransferase family 4 protein [Patescibacteria group bacterium]|nr:glycosyltransferase family 4 protein [Patescibacteria group bacterium]